MTIVDNAVSEWRSVKNGYPMTQSVGAGRPLYLPGGLNGAPVVKFDGLDDELVCSASAFVAALPLGNSPGRMLAVVSQEASAADGYGSRYALCHGNGITSARRIGRAVVSAVNRGRGTFGDGTSAPTSTSQILEMSSRHVIQAIVVASGFSISLDTEARPPTAGTLTTVNNRARIGALDSSTPRSFWLGGVRDAVFTKDLSPKKPTPS